MTARVKQAFIRVGVPLESSPRVKQAVIRVGMKIAPPESPSLVKQAFLRLAIRPEGRRVIVTTD
jgi:hypothetical protein